MKKVVVFLISFALLLTVFATSYSLIDLYYSKKITSSYLNQMGDQLLIDKNQGLALQKEGIKRQDNLFLFGSSELSTKDIPSHPTNLFRKSDFQVNLIGRGYSQSIIHAMNFGALGKDLNNQKVAIILSPQWFTKKGLSQEQFAMNFSDLQFYSLIFNRDLDEDLKKRIAIRVQKLVSQNEENRELNRFLALYLGDDFSSKFNYLALWPYYQVKYKLLELKDKKNSLQKIPADGQEERVLSSRPIQLNWDYELVKAERTGMKEANNNKFEIMNSYYNQHIKDKVANLKGMYKGQSYLDSPEYDDLKLLLEISKQQGIEPLFISVPVHGEWYDYGSFSKSDRSSYYAKVNQLVKSYGFEVLDLSSHEYEDYILKDIMHLGWKGWVYVDEGLDRYYHEN